MMHVFQRHYRYRLCCAQRDKFLDKYWKPIAFQVIILKAFDSMITYSLSFLKAFKYICEVM